MDVQAVEWYVAMNYWTSAGLYIDHSVQDKHMGPVQLSCDAWHWVWTFAPSAIGPGGSLLAASVTWALCCGPKQWSSVHCRLWDSHCHWGVALPYVGVLGLWQLLGRWYMSKQYVHKCQKPWFPSWELYTKPICIFLFKATFWSYMNDDSQMQMRNAAQRLKIACQQ